MTPRPRREYSAETDRGRDVNIPWRRVGVVPLRARLPLTRTAPPGAPRLPRRPRRGFELYLDPALSLVISLAIAAAAWPVGSRAAKSLLGLSEPTERLRERALAVDGVARVDAAAVVLLRDKPPARCGLARVVVSDAARALPAARGVRDLMRRRGAASDHIFVDVRLTREARLAVPGAGWSKSIAA